MKKFIIALSCIVLWCNSFAADAAKIFQAEALNGCRFLNVKISNSTDSNCVLSYEEHLGDVVGNLPMPYTIASGDTVTFAARETLFGVNMMLRADCGTNHSVTIALMQGRCGGLWAEPINHFISKNNHMKVFAAAEIGSASASKPGVIELILVKND